MQALDYFVNLRTEKADAVIVRHAFYERNVLVFERSLDCLLERRCLWRSLLVDLYASLTGHEVRCCFWHFVDREGFGLPVELVDTALTDPDPRVRQAAMEYADISE